jgi:hypothetical protein
MTAQTTTQRTAAHRRRMAEKMARQTAALEAIAAMDWFKVPSELAREALNPEKIDA